MLEIKDAVFPSPQQWEMVTAGMRNPKNSWAKNDSGYCDWYLTQYLKGETCHEGSCPLYADTVKIKPISIIESCTGYVLGENDLKLMKILCQSGSPEHAKFLRQLPIILDIRAPLYWWKQMDQYKIGTVTDSCSTMHKLTDKEFELKDFSFDYIKEAEIDEIDNGLDWENKIALDTAHIIIKNLNYLRNQAIQGNRAAWYMINELLPHSYMQMRTWSGNYETLRNICKQRKGHPLREWDIFINWVRDNVPYAKELIFNEWD